MAEGGDISPRGKGNGPRKSLRKIKSPSLRSSLSSSCKSSSCKDESGDSEIIKWDGFDPEAQVLSDKEAEK